MLLFLPKSDSVAIADEDAAVFEALVSEEID